jgi:hypothetical protein
LDLPNFTAPSFDVSADERARVDVNQRIALTYQLTLLVVHGDDDPIHGWKSKRYRPE